LKDTRIKLAITSNSTIKSPTNLTTIPLSFKIFNQAVDSVNWDLKYELSGS
jgi:hypothetical protein